MLGGQQGCIRREGASEAAPEAFRRAIGGGCQSGWGRLLSVTNAIEAGTCRQGGVAGRRLGALERAAGGGPLCTTTHVPHLSSHGVGASSQLNSIIDPPSAPSNTPHPPVLDPPHDPPPCRPPNPPINRAPTHKHRSSQIHQRPPKARWGGGGAVNGGYTHLGPWSHFHRSLPPPPPPPHTHVSAPGSPRHIC